MTAPPTEPVPGLDVNFHVGRGNFNLVLELTVSPGRTTALLGPNGAGKSTALRVFTGLLRPHDGYVRLDGLTLDGPGVHVPPEKRPVGVVWQDYRLFPNLSALDNVAFGLRTRGVNKADSRATAAVWIERMGLTEHAGKRPSSLSGGQAQRVALARALAPEPKLLLLDEPLAALDARTRLDVRTNLRKHLADFGGATVLVTHDPLDAMVLASDVLVLEDGAAVQRGAVAQVARHPQTDYVARLVGLNLYRGTADADGVRLADGTLIAAVMAHLAPHDPAEVMVAFPPSAVSIFTERPVGTPRNVFNAHITDMELHAGSVRLHLEGSLDVLADVTAGAVAELDLVPGREVWATVKATETSVYPA
ncbi:ABC transporter ATP-binding protein [Sporichthya sp.]|uniref:ABC transporter ATP-binding protein n=1 Tax=Sporichthya sp. TaxID=65475 RepID=UPI001812192C|nr:ABC transporter ATP-binding protein [Sporichthya sp.]MBA3741815.1 ABC transporter ATP-binding protein [Sporichthya sp.]